MSHATGPGQSTPAPGDDYRQSVQPTSATGWVGWIAFASFMMLMLGCFHIIEGLVALFRDEYFLVAKSGLTLSIGYAAWGWFHVFGGILILAAGIGVLVGQMWARITGVLLALISAVLNIGFLSAYPIWSAIMIALDVVVIWALTVHGSEMKDL